MFLATVLLGIAAVGGLAMALIRFTGTPRPPTWLAMLHGVLAASGLVLLINAAMTVGVPQLAKIALGLLILAALGGAYINLQFHWKNLPLPIPLILLHAGVAVAGFGCLLVAVLQSG